MGVVYDDRPILEEKAMENVDGQASRPGEQSERSGRATGKRKFRVPADVCLGRELAKSVERKSRKVSFCLGEYTGEGSCSDRVSWV